jgi:hypothetical protein
MRRLWAAGTAMVVCVALGPVPALAQEEGGATGLTGSLWLQQSEGDQDVYYIVHPDGTLVTLTGSDHDKSGSVGLGVWQQTGDHSLAASWVYGDADPTSHRTAGTSTYRSEWVIDEAAETAKMTYEAAFEPADGTSVPDETGTATVKRLHLQPMFSQADFPTPPEPAWALAQGPPFYGVGAGGLATIEPKGALGDPPEYLVSHADGTSFFVSPYGGNGVGLWAPTGEKASMLSGWFGTAPTKDIELMVVQLSPLMSFIQGMYGTPEAVMGSFTASPERIQPLDPDATLAPPDPELWPSSGTVWVQPMSDGEAIRTAYLADGTVISVHPDHGVGAGLWQPLDADTFASSIGYGTFRYEDWRTEAESTVSPDGEALTTDYRLRNASSETLEETGTSAATRMHLEPLTPTGSPSPSPAS